jgi:hypothetical protein
MSWAQPLQRKRPMRLIRACLRIERIKAIMFIFEKKEMQHEYVGVMITEKKKRLISVI